MTQPRRQRIYATVEQLSIRYRVLDALVKALFPEHDVDSLKGILALAEEKGVDVPREEGRIPPLDPTDLAHSSAAEAENVREQGACGRRASALGFGTEAEGSAQAYAAAASEEPLGMPEGWLVPAPRGGYHYVGTASLVYFAQTVRQLVSQCNLTTMPSFDEAGLKRVLRAAEFTTYKVSHTIEANIRGHPLTVASEEVTEGASNADLNAVEIDAADSIGVRPSPSSSIRPFRSLRPIDHLPDRATSDILVQAFFTHVHPNIPIFHPSAFQVKYEATCSANPDANPFSRDHGWMASLMMVFVLGAQKLESQLGTTQSYELQQKYLSILFRDQLERMALTASLSNVQALVLLSLYQHNAGERNAAWLLIGQAARTAVALGMHRDGENGNFDPFERNTRRLVWWTLYVFEQFISLALGRPSYTETVGVTSALPDATFADSIGFPPSYLEHTVRLAEIYPKVRLFVGATSPHYASADRLAQASSVANGLLADLSSWRGRLPRHLHPSNRSLNSTQRRAVLLLHIWSDYLESIVTRSYILGRVNRNIPKGTEPNRPESQDDAVTALADRCVKAARSSVTNLLELAEANQLEGSVYLDFYALQHATMIIGLHFLGRPPASTPDDAELKGAISALLSRVKGFNLAPTYRIIMNVAMQLAYITGIGPDDDATQVTSSDPLPVPPMAPLAPLETDLSILDFPFQPPPSQQPPSFPGEVAVPTTTFPLPLTNTTQDVISGSAVGQTSLAALEQLFGPMPPSRPNSPPDIFADLYNLGIDISNDNPWDFFDVGNMAQSALQTQSQVDQQCNGAEGAGSFTAP